LAQTAYVKALLDKEKSAWTAVEHERLALAARPSWPYYHVRLADYLAYSGQGEAALKEYRRAIAGGLETEEHYTAPAMELLLRATLQAAGESQPAAGRHANSN